jgi:hypothetical protein
MTCKQSKELFTQSLYNELDALTQKALDDHLASCATCKQEYGAMQQTLSVMDKRARVEPNEGEWNSYWQQLSEKIEKEEDRGGQPNVVRWRPASMPAWAYGIAAMLLIAIGIYAGRTFFNGRPAISVQPPDQPTANVTAPGVSTSDSTTQQTLAYLERTRNLLIGLTNIDETHQATIDLTSHQKISRQLVDQGSILAVSLNKPDQQRTRQLIEDLQIILMQLANTELKPGVPVVELVKKGVSEKSILLKINLEAMRATEHQPSKETPAKKQSNRL